MSSDEPDQTLPFYDAERVDVVRRAFEGAWTAGATPPALEDFVSRLGEPLRRVLFRELLSAEIRWRRQRGEQPDAAHYLSRFSDYSTEIYDALRRSENQPAPVPQVETPRSGLHVRCPHCRNPIELIPDAELDSVQCRSCGSSFSLTSDPAGAARINDGTLEFGRFKLLAKLGAGAFGTVWKAQDSELDRFVALKIPRTGQLDKQQQEAFLREARAAAQLRHPHIVPVYEVGRAGNHLFIVSEFVQGTNLAEHLGNRPIPAVDAARLCLTLANALHHAHEHGVIHRDLKPANVIIDGDGEPHLTDFGLAKRQAHEITMTVDGQILGTPAYMSPEQASGRSQFADRRSDVYSLGVILYEMLTGDLPFRGEVQELIRQVVNDDPPNPRKFKASIPRDLDTLAIRCLEKAPAARPQSALELAEELRRHLRGEPIHARPVRAPERAWRWCRRKPAVAGLLFTTAALLLVLGVAGPLIALRQARLRQTAEQNERAAEQARSETERSNIRLRDEAAKSLFAQGNQEHAAGRNARARELLMQAWLTSSPTNPLRSAYERVMLDRLTHGHRSCVDVNSGMLEPNLAPLPDEQNAVMNIAISQNGRRAIVAFTNGVVGYWDTDTGCPVGKPKAIGSAYNFLASGPQGDRLIASWLDPDRLEVWNCATGTQIGDPIEVLRDEQNGEFSDDGRYFRAQLAGPTIQIFDARTARPIGKPIPNPDAIQQIGYAADASWILTATFDGEVQFWDVRSGVVIGKPLVRRANRTLFSVSLDGNTVVTFQPDGQATLWTNARKNPVATPLDHKEVRVAAINSTGTLIATASPDGAIRFWDGSGSALSEPVTADKDLSKLLFNADGDLLLSTSMKGTARLWQPNSGVLLSPPFEQEGSIYDAKFSADGKRILVRAAGAARIWRVDARWAIGGLATDGDDNACEISFSPDGEQILIAGERGFVYRFNATSCERIEPRIGNEVWKPEPEPELEPDWDNYEYPVWPRPPSFSFSPDGAYILRGMQDGIDVWEVATGKRVGEPIGGGAAANVAFSADGTRILSESGGALRCWDAKTRQALGPPIPHDEYGRVLFSSSADLVVADSSDKSVHVWNIINGKQIQQFKLPEAVERFGSLAASFDNSRVVTSAQTPGTSRNSHRTWLWSTSTGNVIGHVLRTEEEVSHVQFSPVGNLMATANLESGAASTVVQVWNAITGKPHGDAMRQAGSPLSIAFSADGHRLFIGTSDYFSSGNWAQLWDTDTGQPLGQPLPFLNAVTQVAFSPNGERLLSSFGGNISWLISSGVLPAPRDKQAWYELLLGKRLNEADEFVPLSAHEYASRWRQLERDQAWLDRMTGLKHEIGSSPE